MEFRELSDERWQFVQPLLPPRARTGRPRAEDRKALNGILYVLTAGVAGWTCLGSTGPKGTAWRRLKGRQEQGVW